MHRISFTSLLGNGSVIALVLLGFLVTEGTAQVTPDRNFQTEMRTGIGYSVAAPEALAGAAAWHFFGTGPFGAFVDAKMSTDNRSKDRDFCPAELTACTASSVTQTRPNLDFQLRDYDEWLALNAGGAYVLTPEFAVLLGAGMVRQRRYREFVTDEEELWITDDGSFIVDLEPGTDWGPQVMVAGLLRLGSGLAASIGFESRTSGISMGLYWVLP